jgi:hypothetical protein
MVITYSKNELNSPLSGFGHRGTFQSGKNMMIEINWRYGLGNKHKQFFDKNKIQRENNLA